MSVLFLPPSAGAASVPDASETVSGKIRIATSAEATAGTNDLTAMTPAKVKSVIDTAVVGGVTYKGTFDASAPLDLSNAEQGDLYVIDGAGTYQGIVWAVGDHLLVNADMGGTVDPNKIDKIDSTDSVTSVAGRTGAVTLSTADISGLATVASTGAYSDLTGTPTLATVATTGAYSDLSGTPTLGTASAEDVGTLAGNVVQLDGSAKLPAIDGSQLTNLPNGTLFYNTQIASLGPTLTQIADNRRQHYDIALASPANPITLPSATSAAIGGVISFFNSQTTGQAVINCPTARLLSGSSVTSFTVEPSEARSFVWVGTSSLQEITATRLESFNGVSISSPSNGEALVYNGTSGEWENSTVSASVAALNDIGDVSAAAPSDTNVIKYNSTSGDWESGAVAASEVSGLATVATTGAYSDLTGTPTLGTAAALDVGTSASNVVQLNGSAQLPAVDGSLLTGITASVAALNDIGDVSAAAPSDGDVIIYNSTSGDWEASALPIERFRTSVSSGGTLTAIDDNRRQHYDVIVSGVAVTIPNGGSSDVTGGIISVRNASSGNITYKGPATSWADGTQSGFKTLRPYQTGVLVWTSQYTTSEISNLYGTAAGEDVGTSAGNIVQLDGSARLPAVDGSQLTNLPSASVAALNDIGDVSAAAPNNGDVIAYNSTSGDWEATAQSGGSAPSVTVSSPSADQTLSAPSANEEAYIYTPTTPITVNLVAAATCTSGFKYQIKNRSTNAITIDPNGSETIDGASTFGLTAQEASVTLITDGSNWFII